MKLTGESKILLGIVAITVVIIAIASVVMTKPAPTLSRSDLLPTNAHTKGKADAKVYLVEFSDFQCPACLSVKPIVDAILAKHPNDLLFAYRHFPLDQHPFSHKAAQAAEAAAVQGKFWEMYDVLFANQKDFSDAKFIELAKKLNLDMTKFEADMKAQPLTDIVNMDAQAGASIGVNSTPSFFLNDKKLELTSFDDLARAVDEAVANAK